MRYRMTTLMGHRMTALLIVCGVCQTAPAGEMPQGASVVNSLGMRLVRIEPGSFTMGSSQGDFDEQPVHQVSISRSFYLAACEVTNAQYERFQPGHRKMRRKLGFSKQDDEAVLFVDWHDAVRFCRRLAEKEGLPYRLPTEAEWEYACRAGTATAYHPGDALPQPFRKNVTESWFPGSDRGKDRPVSLAVGQTPVSAWGLFEMHGNVEEWCADWYGPYAGGPQVDPVGRVDGDFRVTRGGSHSTTLEYLRSANRSGTLPEDKSWLIGFRVALGPMPTTKPLPLPPPRRHQQDVRRQVPADLAAGPDKDQPYFRGPRRYVKIPPESAGPMFSQHNHCPALVECPNGDLLAIWYTCRREPGRELGILASRLRYGEDEWEPAAPFWDTPDRNDHAPALWFDGKGTIYHFNGLSAAATWGSLATIMRTSTDSGATWSRARLIMPQHGLHHMPVESVFQTREGAMIVPCDAVTSGSGGTTVLVSRDQGQGKPSPVFDSGATGPWIAGIHAGIVQLDDGRLLAFGRGDSIGGQMPQSLSSDLGNTWTYGPSPFPPISGGQRLVVTRLTQGPIFFASFANRMTITDASGAKRKVSGLFGALSFDEGKTWPVRRLITDGRPAHQVDGGGNTRRFTMSPTTAEPRGYMSVCQTADGLIQLISSKQHYAFNVAWLKSPMPAESSEP